MAVSIWITLRYLGARARQTALTLTGVALGVMIVAIMQSYIGGFLNYFIARMLQSTPAVTVTQTRAGLSDPAGPLRRALGAYGNPLFAVRQLPVPDEEETLEHPRRAEALIAALPGVVAVAPIVTGQGLIVNGDLREGVSLLGIEPGREARVTGFHQRLESGSPEALARSPDGIILGTILAFHLSAEPGDRVTLISQQGISRRLRVVGIYAAELEEIDAVRAYVNLRTAQQLLDQRGVSALAVRTATLADAAPVARAIEARTPYTARTWRELNTGFLDLFTTLSLIIYLVVGLTMVVAGFGIANTLILAVSEKMRDIGILKALGAAPRQIAGIFFATGLLIGLVGVAVGLLLGAAGIAIMASIPFPIRMVGETPISVEYFPMLRVPRVYLLSGGFGLLVSLVASLLPAWRAATADPLPVIRGAE
ncbi:MAG TPA: ABC transporter permease [Armatimonadota bacterium]|nr:ABC transporter permease [Armatimonadota bacterium]